MNRGEIRCQLSDTPSSLDLGLCLMHYFPPNTHNPAAFSVVAGEKSCFKGSLPAIVPSGIPNFNK